MPSITPTKGFSIKPKRTIKITPGKEGKLLPEEGKFAIYGKKRPQLLPRKGGRVSTKGGYGAVNRYYGKGGRRMIEKVYSSRYRTVPGGTGTYAVRIAGEKMFINGELNDRAIGWVSEEGQLTTMKDFRDSLISIDATTAGSAEEHPLTELWDSLSMRERADVVSEFRDFDWHAFWEEMYPSKGDADIERQFENYDLVIMKIERAIGRPVY